MSDILATAAYEQGRRRGGDEEREQVCIFLRSLAVRPGSGSYELFVTNALNNVASLIALGKHKEPREIDDLPAPPDAKGDE